MAESTWESMVSVGRIIRPHGNRGEVVIVSDTDFGAERFAPGATVLALRPDGLHGLVVTTSREHDGRWIVGFEGVASINQAETLRGLEVRIPAGDVRPLGAGSYYVHDLVGCQVETVTGAIVGPVRDVQFVAAAPLLAVAGAAGEVLVPLAADICRHVDVAAKRIVIAAPDGLLDLNVPGKAAPEPAEG
jgi:16S rRNA processing protein RimM